MYQDFIFYRELLLIHQPHRVGSVVSESASNVVGHGFASRLGHTKDHHKNGTNCHPAWHAIPEYVKVGVWQCSPTV